MNTYIAMVHPICTTLTISIDVGTNFSTV